MREIVIGNLRLILTIVLILPLTAIADTKDSRVVESRYLSIQLGPEIEQTDLLQSVVGIEVPERITTVGQSLNFLLGSYGFHLDENPETDEHYLLLMLVLPEPHRNLRSMTLMDALITLGGKSFRPQINPVKRSVRYQLREGFGQFATVEDMEVAKKEWLDQKEITSLSSKEPGGTPVAQQEHQTYVPVQRGDSLSHIANQLGFSGMTIDQVLVYLFRANPHAFPNGNMNHLLAGETLKIPLVNLETLPAAFEASQFVDEHYRLWIQSEVTP